MRVFISWSKEQSKAIATALHGWLPYVFESIEPWMSGADIDAGRRWGPEISESLNSSALGILCVTPGNLAEPWLLFEAGALAKRVGADTSKVIPYLFDLEPANLTGNPLHDFQAQKADKDGTRALILSLNRECKGSEVRTLARFEKFWPELEAKLQHSELPSGAPKPALPSDSIMLQEVLGAVQSLSANVQMMRTELNVKPRDLTFVGADRPPHSGGSADQAVVWTTPRGKPMAFKFRGTPGRDAPDRADPSDEGDKGVD